MDSGLWAEAHIETGRGLSAAAADDFCDIPKMAYLGTGWEKKFRMAAAIQNRLSKQGPWKK